MVLFNSEQYHKARPRYSENFIRWLAEQVEHSHKAWDCGAGTGQVSLTLSNYFDEVIATDISQEQLGKIDPKPNLKIISCAAEKTPIQNNSIDLITVGMAAHWFDAPVFYQEVLRVAKPKAKIAIFGYYQPTISQHIDELTDTIYNKILKDYWAQEYQIVKSQYQTLFFPFKPLETPKFNITLQWKLDDYINYLNTLSASLTYYKKEGCYPTDIIKKQLVKLWEIETKKNISFPMFLYIAKVKE